MANALLLTWVDWSATGEQATAHMMEKLANLLFRCWHRRLSRPMAVVRKPGDLTDPEASGFVVCLDCGKKFSYDTKTMSIGKPLKEFNTL